jgi:hypothetical protein
MPTPQILASRVVSHPSGTDAISMALPVYLPGYEWDDWFVAFVVLDAAVEVVGPPSPWVAVPSSIYFAASRFYNDVDAIFEIDAPSSPGWSGLVVLLAVRNGGNIENYNMGGGNTAGSPVLRFGRDLVPALPQDAIAVLIGLVSSAGAIPRSSTSPYILSSHVYRADEVATTVYDDGNRLVMWTGVLPAGSTWPADIAVPGVPEFDIGNWGYDVHVEEACTVIVVWAFIDYAPNPRPEIPDEPPGPCPPHLQATVSLGPVRVLTKSPVTIRAGRTGTATSVAT